LSRPPTESVAPQAAPEEDSGLLGHLGYRQELRRRMGGFSNFAISFSIICILAGGITSLHLGLSAVGGAAAGISWPIGVSFSLIVALCMAQIASAFPTAGGLYHWSALLGGRGWGWATAWLNLLGLVFVTAAVNVGTFGLLVHSLAPLFGFNASSIGPLEQCLGVTFITVTQALFNDRGIRWVTRLTDFSGTLIFVVVVALCAVLLSAALQSASSLDFARLVRVGNWSGEAGGGVWPPSSSLPKLFLLSLIWPLYTVTGFDASAHTAEETVHAARNVPRGIVLSVCWSGLFGWILACSIVLALPDLPTAFAEGAEVFPWLLARVAPGFWLPALWLGIVVANYLCGLACITSTSRLIYAFARDGGVPAARALRHVSPNSGVPRAAVWVTALAAIVSTLYAPAYTTLSAACAIFLYLSYVMPIAAGSLALGRTWTRLGPFRLPAALFRAAALLAVAGAGVVVWIGVQPPNDAALGALLAAVLALPAAWWLGVRRRFPGPPLTGMQLREEPGTIPDSDRRDLASA
jgi:amino acid transporter